MYFATGLEPTNETATTRGSARSWSTTGFAPITTFSTPLGSPAWFSSSATRTELRGTFSEGFNTKVLPQAMAMGNIQVGTIRGKLKGVMPTHTPIGLRTV